MPDPFASAQRVLFASALAEAIGWLQAGAPQSVPARAVRSIHDAAEIPGLQATGRVTLFELRKVDVPDRPLKGGVVSAADGEWSVIQIVDRRDVDAWQLAVERVA